MGKASTLHSEIRNKKELRISQQDGRLYGLIDGKIVLQGSDRTEGLKRLYDAADRDNPKYFGFDGARNRFLHFFAGGFASPNFIRDERGYKESAKERLDAEAPLDKALAGMGFGEAVLSAYRNTNLLSPYEKAKLQDALRGKRSDAFIHGAAMFALGDLKTGLAEMESTLKPHRIANWTATTYLPFLWRPEAHMFLKPEVTRDFALRVGHSFAHEYRAKLDLSVYESLLDLVDETERELADLNPRDRIDVQSFIWVIGAYKDGQELRKT
jgi:hypothetical protein